VARGAAPKEVVGRHHPPRPPRFDAGEMTAIVLAVIGIVCTLLLLVDTPPPRPGPDTVSTSEPAGP
jgi:hypothetical protein